MNVEIFKEIKGWEGCYKISNFGNVYSVKRGHVIKSYQKKSGYKQIVLGRRTNQEKTYFVHRLVACAFIPNKDNLKYVNHKDENKSNNNADNLEWCTASYNLIYSNISQRSAMIRQRLVKEYDLKTMSTTIYINATEAACKYNFKKSTLYRYIRNKRIYKNKLFEFV